MTDPTPRPPAGTDLAPCPDCGGDLHVTVGEDEGDGQWWCLDCPDCGWVADGVDELAPFTLAGAPWTRALWAEVERLRAEAAHRDTWAGLMEQLDRHYPADLTQEGAVLDGPGGAVVRMARDVERMCLELAELRLELAAEQGRQEGAPSAGWKCDSGWDHREWFKESAALGTVTAVRQRDGTADWVSDTREAGNAPSLRAAMQAADEAEAQAAAKEPTP